MIEYLPFLGSLYSFLYFRVAAVNDESFFDGYTRTSSIFIDDVIVYYNDHFPTILIDAITSLMSYPLRRLFFF